ncbi:MAG: YabP/YqfC family sporulation protein [Clostridiales bacterium]|nr:YabP/YqfC family sporulation protein [Clostridiales bacterium]
MEYFTGEPHIEIYGNSQCIVDGLKSVVEYSNKKIKLNIGKKSVTFTGDELYIDSFTPQGAVIEGLIISLEFSNAV